METVKYVLAHLGLAGLPFAKDSGKVGWFWFWFDGWIIPVLIRARMTLKHEESFETLGV